MKNAKRLSQSLSYIFLFVAIFVSVSAKADTYKKLTNLPTVYIETFDKAPVTDEYNYKYCRIIYLRNDTVTEQYDSVQIRGRGNTTWTLPKKPYRIKFASKEKLLGQGHANAKSWTLLANAGDKLLMRNGLSSFVGDLMDMTFTPSCQFVDLYLNGKYQGNYQISDQMQIHKKRVDIYEQDTVVTNDGTDISGGYFMEAEGLTDAGATYISSNNGCHIRIHSPEEDVISSRQKNYIKAYINKFESALFSDQFSNSVRGYRQYTDTASLLAWYLVNEISANPDGFWCSYLYKERADEHLYFGPIWDFDICYNNCSRQGNVTNKLAINFGYGSDYTIKGWYMRMYDDPWFKTAVMSHFDQLRAGGLDSLMYHYIDSVAELIRPSRIENYKVWSISQKVYDEVYLFSTYDEYVRNIKTFIKEHNDYLTTEFHRRASLVPTTDFVASSDYNYKLYSKAFPNMVLAPIDPQVGVDSEIGIFTDKEETLKQEWGIVNVDGKYQIINAETGQALCDEGNPSTEMQLKATAADKAKTNQIWTFVPQSIGGYYNIKNAATGNVLYNYDGMADEGNPVHTVAGDSRDATSSNRMWKPITCGKGTLSAVQAIEAQMDYALAYSAGAGTLRFVGENPTDLVFVATVYSLNGAKQGSFRGDETFDVSMLPEGTYIVSWVFGGSSHSTKFMR